MTQPWQSDPGPQQHGAPQLPPNPYGQQYAPQQPPPVNIQPPSPHAAPPKSQGLAITALVIGIAAAAVAFTTLGAVAWVAALVAVVLAIVALAAKSQGGKMFAAGALAAGLAAFPIAVVMSMLRADQAARNQQQLDCMMEKAERGADVNEIWNC